LSIWTALKSKKGTAEETYTPALLLDIKENDIVIFFWRLFRI
jgi:hypothetical protein